MSLNQIISIEQKARLSVENKRLKISVNDHTQYFAFSDIAVLFLDNAAIYLSNAVLQACSTANIVVLISDKQHIPTMAAFPYAYNNQIAHRIRLQVKFLGSSAMELWAHIVQSRIYSQIEVLNELGCSGSNILQGYAQEVQAGDKTMVEAKATRWYWNRLFGNTFTRYKRGATDSINSRLNYGYAIIRSAVARVLSAYGLNLAIGVGHHRKDNPFNLAEDLVEPFRYIVEKKVFYSKVDTEFSTKDRAELLSMLEEVVIVGSKSFRLFSAIEIVAQSYCRILADNSQHIVLPHLPDRKEIENPQQSLLQVV